MFVNIIQKYSFIGIIGGKVSGNFMGRFENSITNRRVSIPLTFRKLLSPESGMQLVAVRGRLNTIYIFPLDSWKNLEVKLTNGTDEEKELLRKFRFYASALNIEGPGRILLPKTLLDIANINNKVIFLGEGNFFSIWNLESFKKYETEVNKEYDTVLQINQNIL